MVKLDQLQKRIFANKVNRGFNIANVPLELCLIQGELSELFEAWVQRKPDAGGVGDELADVLIYLLGLAEMLGIDLETELLKKVEMNEKRECIVQDGVGICFRVP